MIQPISLDSGLMSRSGRLAAEAPPPFDDIRMSQTQSHVIRRYVAHSLVSSTLHGRIKHHTVPESGAPSIISFTTPPGNVNRVLTLNRKKSLLLHK